MKWAPEDFGRWGDVFEIAVKIGVLNYLASQKWISEEAFPHLKEWAEVRRSEVSKHILRELEVADENTEKAIQHYCEHLFIQGFGLGFTTIRTYIQSICEKTQQKSPSPLVIEKLWCPFSLPVRCVVEEDEQREKDKRDLLTKFWQAMGIQGQRDRTWLKQGQPVLADFLMQWCFAGESYLLCLEFSMRVPQGIPIYEHQAAHAKELSRYVATIERMGVFSSITTEFSEGKFDIGTKVLDHLEALTTRDKPLYKLCQGASYATEWVRKVRARQPFPDVIHTRVIAITNAGLESLHAIMGSEQEQDPNKQLMEKLGKVYREKYSPDDSDDALLRKIRSLFRQLSSSLPPQLRKQLQELLDDPPVGKSHHIRLLEKVEGFVNPVCFVPRQTALGWIEGEDACSQVHLETFRGSVQQELTEMKGDAKADICLRDLHNAAIRQWLKQTPSGEISVLALEGHPGIGKTYAVSHALGELKGGFLFFYTSPRVVINETVSKELREQHPDLVSLTTNYQVNSNAKAWLRRHAQDYPHEIKHPKGGVVFQASRDFSIPCSDIVFLSPTSQEKINEGLGDSYFQGQQVDDTTRMIERKPQMGVMKTLGKACREVFSNNPEIDKIALTGALQGLRTSIETETTTIESFGDQLFRHSPEGARGLQERKEFAKRIPNIVVMIDEISGDATGPLFVHEFASLLHKHFIEPFSYESTGSPFRVLLVLADASLGNALVMESFLSSEKESPAKMLLSQGHKDHPFRYAMRPIRLGRVKEVQAQALHLMADAFPASKLSIDYSLHLQPVIVSTKEEDRKKAHQLIRQQTSNGFYISILEEIARALRETPPSQQVIFFLQDKGVLRELENCFKEPSYALKTLEIHLDLPADWSPDLVAKLDSSVPYKERASLMIPEVRDQKRLFLMTSSGARGISFPNATTIIAYVPNFSVESAMMEIAQLIFRGRGGQGDRYDRKLLMLIHSSFVTEGMKQVDSRQWSRQLIDLVTLLVLLRGTLLTRILGHAELPEQTISMVPVGRVGVEDVVQTMSQSLESFREESSLFLVEKKTQGLVFEAKKLIEDIFASSSWESVHTGPSSSLSVAHPSRFQTFLAGLYSSADPLLSFACPKELPTNLHSNGILWFEDWSQGRLYEDFFFSLWKRTTAEKRKRLCKILRRIQGDGQGILPQTLSRAARNLLTVLERGEEHTSNEQLSRMHVQASQIWAVVPVDYTRFCPPQKNGGLVEHPPLEHHDLWKGFLLRGACPHQPPVAHHPIIPRYSFFPYVAIIHSEPPLNFRRVMDDRYFMASREFNILSSLFF